MRLELARGRRRRKEGSEGEAKTITIDLPKVFRGAEPSERTQEHAQDESPHALS